MTLEGHSHLIAEGISVSKYTWVDALDIAYFRKIYAEIKDTIYQLEGLEKVSRPVDTDTFSKGRHVLEEIVESGRSPDCKISIKRQAVVFQNFNQNVLIHLIIW